jgi:transcriptional regulator with XRE-family HTH domain
MKTKDNDFHRRLISERQRLKLTQQQVATIAGVSVPTQIGYEQGLRSPPSEYMAKLHEPGFDVLFVLLGESTTDLAADAIDWVLMGRIVTAVNAWCASRGVEMSPGKSGPVLRLLYNEFRRKPADASMDVGVVLELLAA